MDLTICELCLEAAGDEMLAAGGELDLLCMELGADIADHLCEEIESDGYTRCACACHPRTKRELRSQREGGVA